MSELTKQALKVDNNQSFPNNNAGLITPTNLRTFNENMIDSLVDEITYNVDSASFNNKIDALSGSVAVNTGSLLTTASFDNNTRDLTFTKGDSSTFFVNIPDVSGSDLPAGLVSGSSQINYPQISNIPAGIVSGSTQITPLLPTGVVSGSTQVLGNTGIVSSSAQIDYPQISNIPTGIVSGSSQLTASYDLRYELSGSAVVLPSGLVSSSAQINYPQISNIPTGIVSGSGQLTGSFVTLDTQQVITERKNFSPSPDGSIGIVMSNATRMTFGSGATQRISSPDSNRLDLETINSAPVSGSPNQINLISGVSGSTAGNGAKINIETRGLQGGQEINVRTTDLRVVGNTAISGALNVSSSLSHSLQEGFVLVGDSSGRTTAVSTGSFGGGGTGNGFPFSGSAVITGSLEVSETIKSQVYINPQIIDGFTIPTGNNAMLVGPVGISGSIVVEGNSKLIVLDQVTGSSTPLPSGVVSGSSQLTASYDLRYALSGSGGGTIDTSSLATTGSNNFIGNQTITGSLSVSSSVDKIVFNGPDISNFSPGQEGGVVVKNSFSVMGDTRLEGAVRFSGQLDVAKIIGNNTTQFPTQGLNISSDVYMVALGVPPDQMAKNLIITGSIFASSSVNVGEALALKPNDPLPANGVGKLAVSGSNLFFNDGSNWILVV